jgi:small subunit ribosomal protein S4
MGKPKFSRKKYETPSHPWQQDRINAENELIKKYGLKNKREIWKGQTVLKRYRSQARELLAKISGGDKQTKIESNQLLTHLTRYNILPLNSTLDDVLALETESVLARRLQTLTYLRGFANTPNQARQLIAHGHIGINDHRITIPGYMVTKNEENDIGYMKDSPLNDTIHPARPSSDFKTDMIKKIEDEQKSKETEKDKKIEEKPTTKKPDAKEEKKEIKKDEKEEKKLPEESKKQKTTEEKKIKTDEKNITPETKEKAEPKNKEKVENKKTEDKGGK